jgi:hypothetical protein
VKGFQGNLVQAAVWRPYAANDHSGSSASKQVQGPATTGNGRLLR